MNRYPPWKYILIIILVAFGFLFALPNIYGKDPAIQISAQRAAEVNELTKLQVEVALDEAGIKASSIELGLSSLILRFTNEETQLRAQSVVKDSLGKSYVVALNLAAATPDWLRKFGAEPMFLGLDLRGGVHFLMEVDMDAAIIKTYERYISDLRSLLRENKVRYKTITLRNDGGLLIRFRDAQQRVDGISLIKDNFRDLNIVEIDNMPGEWQVVTTLSDAAVLETKRFALQQNITTLRKRVNELGVAEPIVQQQGLKRLITTTRNRHHGCPSMRNDI